MSPWNRGNSYEAEPFVPNHSFWQPRKPSKRLRGSIVWGLVVILILCLFYLGIEAVARKARADPPQGTNLASPLHLWFEALKEPNFPSGCCGYHKDCWETDAKKVDGVWYAYYHPDRDTPQTGWWIRVPELASYHEDDPRLPQGYNMAVRAVLCATPDRAEGDETVYCFVPPASTY